MFFIYIFHMIVSISVIAKLNSSFYLKWLSTAQYKSPNLYSHIWIMWWNDGVWARQKILEDLPWKLGLEPSSVQTKLLSKLWLSNFHHFSARPQERPHLGHAQRSKACGLAQWRRHLGRFHGRLQRRAHAAGGPGTSTMTWASPGRSYTGFHGFEPPDTKIGVKG